MFFYIQRTEVVTRGGGGGVAKMGEGDQKAQTSSYGIKNFCGHNARDDDYS